MPLSQERLTAYTNRPVTIFLIGMRINTLHRPDHWMPVMTAFPRMLKYLENDESSGLLASHNWIGRTTISLQYWESPESLRAFAADPTAPHLKPWRDFTRLAGDGHVGIWHETYVVEPGGQESIYGNMPPFGLASARGSRKISGALATARQRLGDVSEH